MNDHAEVQRSHKMAVLAIVLGAILFAGVLSILGTSSEPTPYTIENCILEQPDGAVELTSVAAIDFGEPFVYRLASGDSLALRRLAERDRPALMRAWHECKAAAGRD